MIAPMARLAGPGIVAATAAVAACFSTPRFHGGDDAHVDSSGSGSGTDAAIDMYVTIDGDPTSCTSDSFNADIQGSCGTSGWAQPMVFSGSANTTLGHVELMLAGSGGSYARCVSPSAGYTRFTIEVGQTAQGSNGPSTFVGMENAAAMRFGVLFTWDAMDGVPGQRVLCGSTVGTNATPIPSEWHFIQVALSSSGTVRISSSFDGKSFNNQIGMCTPGSSALAMTTATLSVDSSGSGFSTMNAQFGSIELCK